MSLSPLNKLLMRRVKADIDVHEARIAYLMQEVRAKAYFPRASAQIIATIVSPQAKQLASKQAVVDLRNSDINNVLYPKH